VMIKLMRPGDSILQESPIGKSATLAIRYALGERLNQSS
jgi:hypothetical protein